MKEKVSKNIPKPKRKLIGVPRNVIMKDAFTAPEKKVPKKEVRPIKMSDKAVGGIQKKVPS